MIAFAIIEPGAADLVLFPDGRSEHHPPGLGESVIAQQAALPQPARADVTDADLQAILQARRDEWLVRTAQELARREREAVPGMGTPEGRRNNYLLRNPEPTLESLRAEFASQGA